MLQILAGVTPGPEPSGCCVSRVTTFNVLQILVSVSVTFNFFRNALQNFGNGYVLRLRFFVTKSTRAPNNA